MREFWVARIFLQAIFLLRHSFWGFDGKLFITWIFHIPVSNCKQQCRTKAIFFYLKLWNVKHCAGKFPQTYSLVKFPNLLRSLPILYSFRIPVRSVLISLLPSCFHRLIYACQSALIKDSSASQCTGWRLPFLCAFVAIRSLSLPVVQTIPIPIGRVSDQAT